MGQMPLVNAPPVRNHIRALLESRGRRALPTRVVQIGANDGRTDDPVYKAIIRNTWPALVVEPLPEYFEALKKAYATCPAVTPVNAAIAGHNGHIDFYRVPLEKIDDGTVPRWAHGASSLYPNRNALGWEHVRAHVVRQSVPCMTLRNLLEAHGVKDFDVFQVDAEGHDFSILQQLDFTLYRPAIINFEIVNLPDNEQQAARAFLHGHGYMMQKTGYDLLAVDRGQIHHDDMTGFE